MANSEGNVIARALAAAAYATTLTPCLCFGVSSRVCLCIVLQMLSFTQAALAELQRQDPTVSAIEIDQFHIQCRKSAWLAAYISAGLSLVLLVAAAGTSRHFFLPSAFDEIVIPEGGKRCVKRIPFLAWLVVGLRLDNSDAARPASILPIEVGGVSLLTMLHFYFACVLQASYFAFALLSMMYM